MVNEEMLLDRETFGKRQVIRLPFLHNSASRCETVMEYALEPDFDVNAVNIVVPDVSR